MPMYFFTLVELTCTTSTSIFYCHVSVAFFSVFLYVRPRVLPKDIFKASFMLYQLFTIITIVFLSGTVI